jgi:hypothetical protein
MLCSSGWKEGELERSRAAVVLWNLIKSLGLAANVDEEVVPFK